MEKITLEEFRSIRKKLFDILANAKNSKENVGEEEIIKNYMSIQEKLFVYDLSDIPFEEWTNIFLMNPDTIDLSNTHANIDFSLLQGVECNELKLDGCNIRNLEAYSYNEGTFDLEYRIAHPEFFPDQSLPDDIKKLFYEHQLEFSDLFNYPLLMKCIHKQSFERSYDSPTYSIISNIGYDYAIRMFRENPDFINNLTFRESRDYYYFNYLDFSLEEKLPENSSYEDAKHYIYRVVVSSARNDYSFKIPPFSIIPKDMIEGMPNVFIREGELPKEIVNHYYEGSLTIGEVRKCQVVLKSKDMALGLNNQVFKRINMISGNIWNFLEQVPMELDKVVEDYISSYSLSDWEYEMVSKEGISALIRNAIKKLYSSPFNPHTLEEIYLYNQYVSYEEAIDNENVKKMIRRYGFDNIIEYNRKHHNVLDIKYSNNDSYHIDFTFIGLMARYLTNDEENQTSFNFEEDMQKMFHELHIDEGFGPKQMITNHEEVLKELFPRDFLSKDAPQELIKHFYSKTEPLTFQMLKEHSEWLPFIKDKNILSSLCQTNSLSSGLIQLFERYGDEAVKIGLKNPECVKEMLQQGMFNILANWYDKVNFVPQFVVMRDFPFEQCDKFVSSSKKWSQVMKLDRYNNNDIEKSLLLKTSMCFGLFDNDMNGYNKLMQLFTDVPRTLTEEEMQKIVKYINEQLGYLYENESEERNEYLSKLALLQKSYVKNETGGYVLRINLQQERESLKILRGIMENARIDRIMTIDKAYTMFGDFIMKYDPDFTDFFMKNIEKILSSNKYISHISSMQRQWQKIKTINSNRVMTLDLALDSVMENKYENVEIGNEPVAEVSGIAGYNQQSFDTLQKIYNYGKSRPFSSIPRVESVYGQYLYEILRLDDPLAMAIGTFTNCCQELGNHAETTMEHSMVDKNGRIFVVRDNQGNIVAQSWMWRNGNVVCFDNIEIPDKAFNRAMQNGLSKEHFTDDILRIYQDVAKKLIQKDAISFDKLYAEGKIDKEQYEQLRMRKVTVGIGYNDVKDSIERNIPQDLSEIARPLSFNPPVKLQHDFYTKDSEIQYIVAGDENVPKTSFDTPTLYADDFITLDASNMEQSHITALQRLEILSKKNRMISYIIADNKDAFITSFAQSYGLNPDSLKVIMNNNFAIVYNIVDEEIFIDDIYYNNGQVIDVSDNVLMQIRMALEQIGLKNHKINIDRLDHEQLILCQKAMNLDKEIDEERGISYESKYNKQNY